MEAEMLSPYLAVFVNLYTKNDWREHEKLGISLVGCPDHRHLGCDICQHQGIVAAWTATDGDFPAPVHCGLSVYLDHLPQDHQVAVMDRRRVVLYIDLRMWRYASHSYTSKGATTLRRIICVLTSFELVINNVD